MRTGTEVLKREVLAVWLKGCPSHTIEDSDNLISVLKKCQMGKTEKRDFLAASTSDNYITQGVNNVRRSCIVIYLDMLPKELQTELKEGIANCIANMCMPVSACKILYTYVLPNNSCIYIHSYF